MYMCVSGCVYACRIHVFSTQTHYIYEMINLSNELLNKFANKFNIALPGIRCRSMVVIIVFIYIKLLYTPLDIYTIYTYTVHRCRQRLQFPYLRIQHRRDFFAGIIWCKIDNKKDNFISGYSIFFTFYPHIQYTYIRDSNIYSRYTLVLVGYACRRNCRKNR